MWYCFFAFSVIFYNYFSVFYKYTFSSLIVMCMSNVKVLVTQLCPTLCDPMDYSLPSSSAHGILQARILECVAISFSRGSSQPRDLTQVSRVALRVFTIWTSREVSRLTLRLLWHFTGGENQPKRLHSPNYGFYKSKHLEVLCQTRHVSLANAGSLLESLGLLRQNFLAFQEPVFQFDSPGTCLILIWTTCKPKYVSEVCYLRNTLDYAPAFGKMKKQWALIINFTWKVNYSNILTGLDCFVTKKFQPIPVLTYFPNTSSYLKTPL